MKGCLNLDSWLYVREEMEMLLISVESAFEDGF